MRRKLQLLILFGGKSAEHEVSLQSAVNVVRAVDTARYDILPVGIDKSGHWRLYRTVDFLQHRNDPSSVELRRAGTRVTLLPFPCSRPLIPLSREGKPRRVDVAFPVLHGPFGEDGTVQGLLRLAGIPFVGAGVLGSAVGMDKDVMKRLLRDAGLPIPDFVVLRKSDSFSFDAIRRRLGLPVFVKPANMGSSVGISKVRSRREFDGAVNGAFLFDSKILVEEYVKGREIECSVLGLDRPSASVPGEVVPRHDFYSYAAKYLDDDGAELKAPAELSPRVAAEVKRLAVEAFKALCAEGMGRVDFFLRPNGQVLINELNTIPGFTKISMYPRLWALSGIDSAELVDRLIRLALQRARRERHLRTSVKMR
jgi:D-alanine-D-alanine ligase